MGTVKYLLDTHTFLWAIYDDARFNDRVRNIMNDKNAQKYVSAISAYEIMYKYKLGKLPEYAYVAENYFNIVENFGATELPVSTRHAHFAGNFEWAHRDPFDRLLAAQSFVEKLTLITNDDAFVSLPWVSVLW